MAQARDPQSEGSGGLLDCADDAPGKGETDSTADAHNAGGTRPAVLDGDCVHDYDGNCINYDDKNNCSSICDVTTTLENSLRLIKRDLAHPRDSAQITEAIPLEPSAVFPVPLDDLCMLRRFASENPIYRDSAESFLAGTKCMIYHGDINRYWLGSILHEASRAPFSPTWIASAYVLSRLARDMGYAQVVDIGSGDGRIAFCASILGLDAHGIEIDPDLSRLQSELSQISRFKTHCIDATLCDYSLLDTARPAVFFVGGLAQMGGESLTSAIMERLAASGLAMPGWVFAGTKSPKYAPDPEGMHGWGDIMRRAGLVHERTVELPSAWTLDQPYDTQYIFASTCRH